MGDGRLVCELIGLLDLEFLGVGEVGLGVKGDGIGQTWRFRVCGNENGDTRVLLTNDASTLVEQLCQQWKYFLDFLRRQGQEKRTCLEIRH